MMAVLMGVVVNVRVVFIRVVAHELLLL